MEEATLRVESMKEEIEWDDFVASKLEGTFYHSAKWKNLIERVFDYESLYLTLRDSNDEIVGIVPGFIRKFNRMVLYDSLPFGDQGGPMIESGYEQEGARTLLAYFKTRNVNVDCVKARFENLELAHLFETPLTFNQTDLGLVDVDLNVTPSDFIWNKLFSENRRRQIRRVEKDGFLVHEATTRSEMNDFYELYRPDMESLGVQALPYEFLETAWDLFYPENLQVWLLERERPVGGVLLFKERRTLYCFLAAVDKSSTQRHVIPYLWWRTIKTGEQTGYTHLSLGGTPKDPGDRYNRQKIRFGGTFHLQETVWYPLSISSTIRIQARSKATKIWTPVKKHLPEDVRTTMQNFWRLKFLRPLLP